MSTSESSSLSPGDRLGRYEIVAPIGAGGMGEVYRARDPTLHRDVAVKVLHRTSGTAEDFDRFSREARTAGSLNHPNIVAVFDVGTHEDRPYVVTELLEGETLRARLDRGPLPLRKAIDYALQIAEALDAVHVKGIWHRDVKPANAFVTTEGRVKLLDFGIAKLGEPKVRLEADEPTQPILHTHPGLGTLGYISPEQVLGLPADHRADIFAFGAMAYEMFTHSRAFKRPSVDEMRHAILYEDPPDPLAVTPQLPPLVASILRRCLDKNKEERFQSARDLGFALKQVREQTEPRATPPAPLPSPVNRTSRFRWAPMALLLLAAVAAGWLLRWLLVSPATGPSFEQLTFRRARISAARFVLGGQAVVYSDVHQGNDLTLWRHDLGQLPPTEPLKYAPGTDVLAATDTTLALLVKRSFITGERFVGTLALAPLTGGDPREDEAEVEDAEFDPSGKLLAIVRSRGIGGGSSLEYPAGTTLYKSDGAIRFPRFSRDGRAIAFIEYPAGNSDGGSVALFDLGGSGTASSLTDSWTSVRGLAWSPDGNEIWFAAGRTRTTRELRAVTRGRVERVVLSAPGSVTLWDVATDGRVLLTRDEERRSLVGLPRGQSEERDLSWYDDTGLADISDDGRWLLFGDRSGLHLRDVERPFPVHLGVTDAYGDDLSPDGKWILATTHNTDQLIVMPNGPGPRQLLPRHQIEHYSGARWFPDARRVLFTGNEARRGRRSYIQEVQGGAPVPLTPEGVWGTAISPDGATTAAIDRSGIILWPVDGRPTRRVPNSEADDRPIAWSDDGQWLWVFHRGKVPAPLYKLNIATGQRQLWRTLVPSDAAGMYSVTEAAITPDGRSYFYSYRRLLSQLYLVRSLR